MGALAAAAAVMAATIVFSLLFPLAIGEVFDVCRQQGAFAGQAADGVAAQGFLGLPTAASAARTPPSFQRAIFNLFTCLMLSAAGNAGVAYIAPVIGERFGTRLKTRLMQVRGWATLRTCGRGSTRRLTTPPPPLASCCPLTPPLHTHARPARDRSW